MRFASVFPSWGLGTREKPGLGNKGKAGAWEQGKSRGLGTRESWGLGTREWETGGVLKFHFSTPP